LDGKVYPLDALGLLVVNSNPKPGTSRSLLTFDGTVMGVMPTQITVVDRVRLPVGTETIPALQLRINRAKLDVTIWIDSLGLSIREESPVGMSSIRTTPELAAAGELEGASLDLMTMFSVPTDTTVPEPSEVQTALLEITGIDSTILDLSGGSQRVISRQPLRVEVRSELPEVEIRLPIRDMKEYLRPTISLPSDDPRIVQTARQIVGNERSAVTASQRLLEWVYRSLEKRATASFPNARDVLEQMSGDCNEHATLYAAMARSVGIPCRVAVGLVYLDRAFYYHAWNEVYLGSWVPIDPTFGEFPAGALRLRLASGEIAEQSQVLAAARRIGIRIVEFR
ncbi:MAG: transglutaminase domain-containing protein, partial [candidate division WOR-3 bacterium]